MGIGEKSPVRIKTIPELREAGGKLPDSRAGQLLPNMTECRG